MFILIFSFFRASFLFVVCHSCLIPYRCCSSFTYVLHRFRQFILYFVHHSLLCVISPLTRPIMRPEERSLYFFGSLLFCVVFHSCIQTRGGCTFARALLLLRFRCLFSFSASLLFVVSHSLALHASRREVVVLSPRSGSVIRRYQVTL